MKQCKLTLNYATQSLSKMKQYTEDVLYSAIRLYFVSLYYSFIIEYHGISFNHQIK